VRLLSKDAGASLLTHLVTDCFLCRCGRIAVDGESIANEGVNKMDSGHFDFATAELWCGLPTSV
jgi:hypothetical protein